MSFYEQNDSGLSPSAYDLPLPSGDSAPDSNYRFNINKFKLTTPKIEATVENVIKFRDELERAFGAMNIHDYLELPEYVPPDLNLTYPVINHTSQADNIPDLADEVVRKVEDLMIENANRLSREVLFYKTKNGWYPWEEGHYKRPMVCIDDIVQPMPDEMLYPEPRLVEPPKAEEDLWEKRLRELEMAWIVFQELARRFMRFTDACLVEGKKEEVAPSPAIKPDPLLNKKTLRQRVRDFLVRKGFLSEGNVKLNSENPLTYKEREQLRKNVMTPEEAEKYIDYIDGLPENEKEKRLKEKEKGKYLRIKNAPPEEDKAALYKRLKEAKGEAVNQDDRSLYALMTLSHGAKFAKDFVAYRERRRHLLLEIKNLQQKLVDLTSKIKTLSGPARAELVAERNSLYERVKILAKEFDDAWDVFAAAHGFEVMVPNKAFLVGQTIVAARLITILKNPAVNARLRTCAQEVRRNYNPNLAEPQRSEKFNAAMLKLLRQALQETNLKGEISIEKFRAGDWRNGFASGNEIHMNSNSFFTENGDIDFAKVIKTLFHEAAHILQHAMSEEERKEIFGPTSNYYMDGEVNSDIYTRQDIEAHACFMGEKIAEAKITDSW